METGGRRGNGDGIGLTAPSASPGAERVTMAGDGGGESASAARPFAGRPVESWAGARSLSSFGGAGCMCGKCWLGFSKP